MKGQNQTVGKCRQQVAPFASGTGWTLYHGDAREVLRGLPDKSVHVIITSPPYLGLRDYQLPPAAWGGDPFCIHEWSPWQERHERREPEVAAGRSRTTERFYGEPIRRFHGDHQKHAAGAFCRWCGAWLGTLGMEPHPDLYVAHFLEIARELHRVLRDDGLFWLNVGDSYNGSGGAGGDYLPGGLRDGQPKYPGRRIVGLKPKDLVGIPWRLALALQADGWIWRTVNIWFKRNGMPDSASDRPAISHEYVFQFAKKPRYYYDKWAVTRRQETAGKRIEGRSLYRDGHPSAWSVRTRALHPLGTGIRSVWAINTRPVPWEFCGACGRLYEGPERSRIRKESYPDEQGRERVRRWCECGRSDAWVDHFATFPPGLVEVPLLLSTSPFACPHCGTPWRRVIRKGKPLLAAWSPKGASQYKPEVGGYQRRSLEDGSTLKHVVPVETVGWRPSCSCESNDGGGRCVVLDPFVGSGTTMLTALQYGRIAIGIDLSEPYCRVAAARLARPQQQVLDLVREAPLSPRVAVQTHPGPRVAPEQVLLPLVEGDGQA